MKIIVQSLIVLFCATLSVGVSAQQGTGQTFDILRNQEIESEKRKVENRRKRKLEEEQAAGRAELDAPGGDRLNEIALLYADLVAQLPQGSALLNAPYPQGFETFGKTEPQFDLDSDIAGGVAMKLNIEKPSKNSHKQGVNVKTILEINAGDVLCLTFWARARKSDNGTNSAYIASLGVQKARRPFNKILNRAENLDLNWSHFSYAFKAEESFDKEDARLFFHYGNYLQNIELGPAMLFNLGAVDLSQATGKACKA